MFLQLSRLLLLGSLLGLAFGFTAAQQQWQQTSAAAPSEEETTEEPEADISSTSSQIGDETEEEAEQQQKVQKPLASCDVFDPFKVLPAEPGHFQIGGAFPLHGPDCLELDAASVQDVVAVQWAMAYWNEQKKATDAKEEEEDNDTTKAKQSQKGRRPKLGLFAGDSCSRPKEAIAQSLRFLDSLGYHEPGECVPGKGSSSSSNPLMAEAERKRKSAAAAKIIALLAPRDRESAEAVAQVVRPSGVPVAVYSPAAAQAFLDASVAGFVTTAPLLADFGRSLVALLGMLGSDLVSIVDYGEGFSLSAKLVEQLRQQGISVAELVPFDHPQLASMLAASDAQIIVSLVSNQLLAATGVGRQSAIRDMDKLWITLELEAGYEPTEEPSRLDFLAPEEKQKAKLQVLTIRRQQRYLADFNAYFLRILLTNYEHYSLLNGYVQHVYNCSQQQTSSAQKTGGGKKPKAVCSQEQLEPRRLAQLHKQSPSLEPIVLLVYALARTAQRVEQNAELLAKCATPSAACFDGIRAELLQMGTEEATSPAEGRLPPGFGDRLAKLRFFETGEGAIQAAGIGLEAVLLEKEGRDGGNIYRLLEYYTGLNGNDNPVGSVEKAALPQRLRQIRSRCPRHRAYCQEKCRQATRRPDDQTFLSLPEHFSLYLSAMFDFQSGPNCDRLRRSNPASVAMPLAFVHAMSTFRQRHSPESALFRQGPNGQMDIGSLLVDTCSSGRTLMEFLVDSERNCYKFSQVERNWTIAAGATIGYVFGSEELGPSQAGMLGAISAGPSASPVISTAIGGDAEAKAAEEAGGLFSFEPSHRAFGMALAKFLRRMHWTYVNVVLDRSDATSVSLYDHFVRQSAGTICTADLTIVGDGEAEEKGGRRASRQQQQQQAGNKRTAAEQLRFGAMAIPNANVTLVFGAAKTAAEWMSARLRDEFLGAGTGTTVHVMLGEAHDFYLHDPTNLAQYAGTVSFQTKDVSSADFHDWLRSITPLTLPEIWYWRHVEENWQCALARSNIQRFHGRMCSGEELLNVNGMGRLTRAGYLARGVDRLLSAIDEAHKKLCPEGEKLCEDFTANGRKLIRELLAKVDKESADQFEAYQLITSGGHQGKLEYKMFANYSSAGGQLQLLADYRPPFAGSNEPASGANSLADDADRKPAVVSRCRGPFCRCRAILDLAADSPTDQDSPSLASSTYIRREPATGANSRKEDSAEELVLLYENDDPEVQQLAGLAERELTDALRIVLAVLSAMLCALAAATLLLILIKMYQRRIKGHQSLGLLLLCGICALFADAFLFASAPSDLICHLRIAVHALAHALCFGVIIVKAIQLRNAETLALMGATAQQISYWNYWLLLAFIFAVQLVICLKWLLAKPLDWLSTADHQTSMGHLPPAASGDRVLLCSYSSPNFVLAQVYSFLLLFLALLLSAQNRNIKRNYKEAKWLFITSLSCTLLLCAWAACHVLVSPLYLDHMTVLELHLTGTVLLAFVFGPKLYVLLFYEPVVVECVYGGSLGPGGGRDSKAGDLFEAADWCHGDDNCTSPTLTNRSDERHRMNGGGPVTEEDEEERVTSAFQTILRKKTSAAGNGNKRGQNGATNSHCPTPRMGQRGGGKQKERLTEPQQRTRRAEHPGAAQNV